ncbi:unnamed protein product [Pylaiella littoralis]
MKTSAASLFRAAGVVACCCSCARAFIVSSSAMSVSGGRRTSVAAQQGFSSSSNNNMNSRRTMTLSAENKDEEEQAPMDLDLEQMFEVFDAADKEVSDEDVGKKGSKKSAGDAKDPAEAMGDMLSSFFGGGKK